MRKWAIILGIAFIIMGVGVISFPYVQEFFYKGEVSNLKQEFLEENGIKEIANEATNQSNSPTSTPNPQHVALYNKLKEENERLFQTGQTGVVDAFFYERAGINLFSYGISDNCIGFISLPSIEMELPIYLGANKANMRKGAVHLTETSYPIGGENTNCVIAAHRGTSLVMFRNIHKIKVGDEVIITNFQEQLRYIATEIKTIEPTDIEAIKIQKGKDMVTLISCNPLGQNYQRYLVYCERAK